LFMNFLYFWYADELLEKLRDVFDKCFYDIFDSINFWIVC